MSGEHRDLRLVGGEPVDDSEPPADAVQRHQQARETPKAAVDEQGEPVKGLTAANKLAGLARKKEKRIVRVVQRGEGNAAVIDLEFAHGARVSATVKQVFDPRWMEGALTLATKIAPDWATPKEWRVFGVAVLQAAMADEATDTEAAETCEWLRSFFDRATTRELTAHNPTETVQLDDSAALFDVLKADEAAFRGSDGRLYVRVPKLGEHVAMELRQRVTSSELRQRLGRIGFT